MKPIREIEKPTPELFRSEILQAGQPVVFRGFVRDWPVVQAAQESDETYCEYIKAFDRGYNVNTAYGPPSIRGRVFYNDDLSGINCRLEQVSLSSSLDYMLAHRDEDPAPTVAVQSVQTPRYLPGFEAENQLPHGFVPDGADPRIWIGSRTTVAAHYDPSENIACCIAGSRRFTLFPPDQVANLYVGPFELTPSGATISMVDFANPDEKKFPNFAEARDAAVFVDLEPGDAVYVPYLWWHHVESSSPVNGLVNYWWATPDELRGDPRNALLHAMLSIKSLPPTHRDAWRALFDVYVFETDGETGTHLPEDRRGILGKLEPGEMKKMRAALGRALGRG